MIPRFTIKDFDGFMVGIARFAFLSESFNLEQCSTVDPYKFIAKLDCFLSAASYWKQFFVY